MAKEGILKFPMVAVNDADCKHLLIIVTVRDSLYGTAL